MRARIILAAVVALAALATAVSASALEPGERVTFLLPQFGGQPEPSGGPTDRLVYMGGKVARINAFGCLANASAPEQAAVLLDPAGQSRTVTIVTVRREDGSNEPLPAGTRLRDPRFDSDCIANGTAYNRYVAIVDG